MRGELRPDSLSALEIYGSISQVNEGDFTILQSFNKCNFISKNQNPKIRGKKINKNIFMNKNKIDNY